MLLVQLAINGIIQGGIYAVVSLGFALIYRGAKVFHIAHGAIYTLGAYIFFTFTKLFNWNLPLAILLSLFLTSLIGLLPEELVYYPIFKRKGSSLVIIIASLGIYTFIVNSIALFFGNETKVSIIMLNRRLTIGNLVLTHIQILKLLVSILIIIGTYLFIEKTQWGISIKALSNNQNLLRVLGFNIKNLRRLIFVLGSFLACVASILVSIDIGIDPWGGMSMLLSGAIAMIIGGLDKLKGAIFGGFFLGLLQSISVWKLSTMWQNTTIFIVLIFFLLFRPQGILGNKKRIEEI